MVTIQWCPATRILKMPAVPKNVEQHCSVDTCVVARVASVSVADCMSSAVSNAGASWCVAIIVTTLVHLSVLPALTAATISAHMVVALRNVMSCVHLALSLVIGNVHITDAPSLVASHAIGLPATTGVTRC